MTRDLASFLSGRWSVERALSEGDDEGSFVGTAEFVPGAPDGGLDAGNDASSGGGDLAPARAPDRLIWDEHGRMRWRGNDLAAFRRLELVRTPGEGGGEDGWEVRFDDGRPFHPLDLSEGSCSAVHPCGEDYYEGRYRVLDEDTFEVRWRVRGPRKDQRIVSLYRRA